MAEFRKLKKRTFYLLSALLALVTGYIVSHSSKSETSDQANVPYAHADIPVTFTPGDGGGGGADSADNDSDDGCFVAGTKILMADGSQKNIEDIELGDNVMTSKGASAVEKLFQTAYKADVYALNGSDDFFFTPSHPFMTKDGWKSVDPEKTRNETPSRDIFEVKELRPGDVLFHDGQEVLVEELNKKYVETVVYNFRVGGTHDYYANGYWVHNAK